MNVCLSRSDMHDLLHEMMGCRASDLSTGFALDLGHVLFGFPSIRVVMHVQVATSRDDSFAKP